MNCPIKPHFTQLHSIHLNASETQVRKKTKLSTANWCYTCNQKKKKHSCIMVQNVPLNHGTQYTHREYLAITKCNILIYIAGYSGIEMEEMHLMHSD